MTNAVCPSCTALRQQLAEMPHCSFSTGIDGGITAGRGRLDHNGYWEFPCEPCVQRADNNRRLCEQVSALEVALAQAQQERDEARKDADYHADCRPNRKQAEAWRDDAKAMNDKWADEHAARVAAESRLSALTQERDALKARPFDISWDGKSGGLTTCNYCGEFLGHGHNCEAKSGV